MITLEERKIIEEKFFAMICEAQTQIEILNINEKDFETKMSLMNYERGMIRGFERALNLFNDLKEVVADERERAKTQRRLKL